ncbi:MAG: hypothetical protein IMZ53_14045, partial [Thermoplasmata archaeon]|nr:hypothetical protein [Thermoplasmata archaeon]
MPYKRHKYPFQWLRIPAENLLLWSSRLYYKKNKPQLKGVYLMIINGCNLACPFCLRAGKMWIDATPATGDG